MSVKYIFPSRGLQGEIQVPGDKSISHRSVMLGSIARGTTEITGFLSGADCLSTIDCFQKMGVKIVQEDSRLLVHGRGLRGLSAPADILNVGNSGTTTRLMSGILAGQSFSSSLSGDASLNTRPMKRIMTPLNHMGARIQSIRGNDCAPLQIDPGFLHGIDYESPVASAQVKSAVLLAGLYADSPTSVTEPTLSRDHTERMLASFGATIHTTWHAEGHIDGHTCASAYNSIGGRATAQVLPCEELYARQIDVPGDISSAAYFIAAALLVPDSELLIKNVGINPTRAGFLTVCNAMGADITLLNQNSDSGEERADLLVRFCKLHAVTVEGSIIPTLIDEIPIIAVLAAHAQGTTIIKDAAELKVKETNRIDTITEGLQSMGVNVTPADDGMIIEGGHGISKPSLTGAKIQSYLDHRIAMAFAIAGLAASGETRILDSQCVDVSYPGFFQTLKNCQS